MMEWYKVTLTNEMDEVEVCDVLAPNPQLAASEMVRDMHTFNDCDEPKGHGFYTAVVEARPGEESEGMEPMTFKVEVRMKPSISARPV